MRKALGSLLAQEEPEQEEKAALCSWGSEASGTEHSKAPGGTVKVEAGQKHTGAEEQPVHTDV